MNMLVYNLFYVGKTWVICFKGKTLYKLLECQVNKDIESVLPV